MGVLLAYLPFKEGYRSARWPSTSKNKNLYFLYPPWFLAYSASLLERENIEVDLVDAVAEDMDDNQFIEYVKKKDPDLIVAEITTITSKKDLQLLKLIKNEVGCNIAVCGSHATALHEDILKNNSHIDFVLLGEYELTILELSKKLQLHKYEKIFGLAFREKNKIKVNPRKPLIEILDSLPFPARHFLTMERYNEPFAEVPNQQMITSRGCPFRCVFCVWPQILYDHKVRFRSPKNIVDEMELLVKEYKPKEIYFDDDSFTLSQQHILEICKEIKERGLDIQWSCMGHANLSEDVLKKMKDAGCVGIKFGVETASPEVMKKIKKALDLNKVKEFAKISKKLGFRTHATYMIGLPGDTKETIDKTLKFAVNLGTNSFQISIATPFPGTEFYDMAKKNGWLVTDDFSRYDGNKEAVVSYPWLSKEEIDEEFKKALSLTSRLDLGLIKYFMRYKYQTRGLGGILSLPKEGFSYSRRLLRKKVFSLKAKYVR